MTDLAVLLVEDNKVDQLIFKRFVTVQNLPYQVSVVGSVAEAKAVLSLHQYDIVISDFQLGDGSALDLIDVVLAHNTPIVVVTGGGDEEIAVKMIKAGAYDYLIKNMDQSHLKFLPITVDNAIKHHRAEKQAHLLSQALMSIHESVCITDPEGDIIFVNKGFSEMYGYELNEVLGRPIHLLERETSYMFDHKNADEYHYKRKDGQLLSVLRSKSALADRQGKPMALVEITHDITERKQAEKAEKELAQMKDEFIASISHQLRTPLTSAKGFLDLLRRNQVDEPEVQQEFIESVAGDVDHLIELVNNILDIFRLESGRFPLERTIFNLSALVIETVHAMEGLAGQKKIPLTHDLSADQALFVNGDRRWLREVLVNFLSNAIKFSEAGQPIRVTSQTQADQVFIKVIDRGPGIASHEVTRLFGKFYQADSPQKEIGAGSGLGLYISKQIIEGHGGQIGVDSEKGEGSIFYFCLPLLPEARSEPGLEKEF